MRNTKLITVPKTENKGQSGLSRGKRLCAYSVRGSIGQNIYTRFRASLKANHNLKRSSGVNYASYIPGDMCSAGHDNFTLISQDLLFNRLDEGYIQKLEVRFSKRANWWTITTIANTMVFKYLHVQAGVQLYLIGYI